MSARSKTSSDVTALANLARGTVGTVQPTSAPLPSSIPEWYRSAPLGILLCCLAYLTDEGLMPSYWQLARSQSSQLSCIVAAARRRTWDTDERIAVHTMNCVTNEWMEGCGLKAKVNEVYLWHGTKYNFVEDIEYQGFDERNCSPNGLDGAGIYFGNH